MTRVAITGIGVVTPIGIGKKVFWENLKSGKSGGKRLDVIKDDQGIYPLQFEENVRTKVGAPVLDFNPLDYIPPKKVKHTPRATQFALAATKLALKDANFTLRKTKKGKFQIKEINTNTIGTVVGVCIGGIETLEKNHGIFLEQGARRVSPFFAPQMMNNNAAGEISIRFGIEGLSYIVGSACASGNYALTEGFDKIKLGKANIIIAGGTEAILTPFVYGSFSRLKATTAQNDNPQKASRPFDKKRDGFLPGEGAGILILESLKHAQKRGARIYAEISGYGSTSDAYHITAPDPEGKGAKRAMEQAIKESKINTNDVDYINAHGTATTLNDAMETKAIKSVFGKSAYDIPVSSNKSQIGHLVSGAGAVEAAATILTIQESIIPPTINYKNYDPECDLDCVPNKARLRKVDIALSNSFGFGGHNCSICLTRFQECGEKQ